MKFKCTYLQTEKHLLNFFLHFRNVHIILNTLKKKMSLRGDYFLKLKTPKSWLTKKPKRPHVRTLMESQHVKGSETLLKLTRQLFVLFLDHSERKSVLVVCEILRLFVNKLRHYHKYFLSVKVSV